MTLAYPRVLSIFFQLKNRKTINKIQQLSMRFGKHSRAFSQKNLSAGISTYKQEISGSGISKCMVLKLVH
jgi:hypothetical protein